MNAQKMGEHEAEIEKIKNVFLVILRDIKKDIDNGERCTDEPGFEISWRKIEGNSPLSSIYT